MSDDPVAIWREAIKDDQHPRNKAVWLLFSENMSPRGAAKLLANQKEAVIPWLYEILDTEALYDEGSFGDGDAPINACYLLGEWKVMEAVPRLWQLVTSEDWESIVHGAAIDALEEFGSEVIDFLLERSAESGEEIDFEVASILSEAGRGDQRAFEFICGYFQRQKENLSIAMAAELMLRCNSQAGIEYLEQQIQLPKYRQSRKILTRRIQEARDGEFDN